MPGSGYVGRFAPSPTGRLHIGSLLAAVASWCDARHHKGEWLVRMEDLDPPREVAGAADDILRTLEGFGLSWDRTVRWQSQRHAAYQQALEVLVSSGRAYPCGCSRKEWEGHASYPGTCRVGLPEEKPARLQRFALDGGQESWTDLILGDCTFEKENLGDFPLLRADGHWAYQLAVVVDDMDQGITHVIRGADLLDSTPRQLALWKSLSVEARPKPLPAYGHLPVLTNAAGQKLSKQTLARPVEASEGPELLDTVWGHLGQDRHDGQWLEAKQSGSMEDMLLRGAQIWSRSRIPTQSIPLQGWGQDEAS